MNKLERDMKKSVVSLGLTALGFLAVGCSAPTYSLASIVDCLNGDPTYGEITYKNIGNRQIEVAGKTLDINDGRITLQDAVDRVTSFDNGLAFANYTGASAETVITATLVTNQDNNTDLRIQGSCPNR